MSCTCRQCAWIRKQHEDFEMRLSMIVCGAILLALVLFEIYLRWHLEGV